MLKEQLDRIVAERDAAHAADEEHRRQIRELLAERDAAAKEASLYREAAGTWKVEAQRELVGRTEAEAERDRYREALERIAELDAAWVFTDNVRGTHLVKLARVALDGHVLPDDDPGPPEMVPTRR